MNIYTMIPAEFYLMRRDTLTRQLDELPVIRSGHKRQSTVLRVYDESRRHYREVSTKSRSWAKYESIYLKRTRLESALSLVEIILDRYHDQICRDYHITNTDNHYGNKYYDALVDSSCTYKNESKYYYNGRNYRSRSEMLYATVLDELGLEFKYDVNVVFNGREFSVDFVIVIREFNRCIFVEYFGRCSDFRYNHHNMVKLEHAQADRIYINRDIFIVSGDSSYTPGTDLIRVHLASIIAQLSAYHIKMYD